MASRQRLNVEESEYSLGFEEFEGGNVACGIESM